MRTPRLILMLSFILLGIASRFVPHLPNFTAINAIAIMGTFSLGSTWLSFFMVSGIMLSGDLVFGFHNAMPFVYLSYGLITLLGNYIRTKNSLSTNFIIVILASLLFYTITNFGEWLMGSLYAKTFEGLILCYLAGIPFLLNQILGDFLFSGLIMEGTAVYRTSLKKLVLNGNKNFDTDTDVL